MKKKFETKLKQAVASYRSKLEENLAQGRISSIYKALRRMGAADDEPAELTLIPDHQKQGLTLQESVDLIAAHFAEISQKLDPIDTSKLPPNVRAQLENFDIEVPVITEYKVYNKQRKAKKPVQSSKGISPRRS